MDIPLAASNQADVGQVKPSRDGSATASSRFKPATDWFRGRVRDRALRRIKIFGDAGDDWRFAESLKSITEDTAQEYEGRTLLELIQNAHDALPADSPGRIQIILDLDHSPGILYVANEGRPFTSANFNAITELALSDKETGEGIGNKGLGFRSVLQLTDWPEVYSKADDRAETFDGYCFRFASPDDVFSLVENLQLAARVVKEVSSLALPVPAEVEDPVVEELGGQGYVTVIRLPLRNEAAARAARRQIDAVSAPEAPLLLFLDRVTALQVQVRTDGVREEWELTRRSAPCPLLLRITVPGSARSTWAMPVATFRADG